MRAALRVSQWNAKTCAIGAPIAQLHSMVLLGSVSRSRLCQRDACHTPRVEDWQEAEARVRASFGRQGFMQHIGARLVAVGPGTCEIACAPQAELSQQHGFVHAGVVAAIADSAAGYAALSLTPPGSEVLTVEFKLNLLAPARGDLLIARGTVLRPGRTLTVCEAAVVAVEDGGETQCAAALVTLMRRA
jgi:uncharacterized protein (TIGR00369 family)